MTIETIEAILDQPPAPVTGATCKRCLHSSAPVHALDEQQARALGIFTFWPGYICRPCLRHIRGCKLIALQATARNGWTTV